MALNRNYPNNFERIWKAYPKGKGGSKERAYKAYQKVDKDLHFNNEDIDEIVSRIEERKRVCVKWTEGRYIKNASTYIVDMDWEEDYARLPRAHQAGRIVPVETEAEVEERRLKHWAKLHSQGVPIEKIPEQYRGRLH